MSENFLDCMVTLIYLPPSILHNPFKLVGHQKLSQFSYRWRTIGEGLGFNSAELSTIEATPSLFHGGPTAYMSEMLSKWYQWAPGDARGSKNYATVDSLAMSVDKAGLGVTANELRNLK